MASDHTETLRRLRDEYRAPAPWADADELASRGETADAIEFALCAIIERDDLRGVVNKVRVVLDKCNGCLRYKCTCDTWFDG